MTGAPSLRLDQAGRWTLPAPIMSASSPPAAEPRSSELSFEDLLKRLESLVTRLEGGELSLEDALAAYQEGVGLARAGHERLSSAERRIEEVARGGQISAVAPSEVLEPEGSR